MSNFLNEVRLLPVLKGNLKRLPLIKSLSPKKTGGTSNVRYCYSVWLRHLSYIARCNENKIPEKIMELGPGDSLGVGLAALLCGAEKYTGLDIIKFWNTERNLLMLEDLLALFKSRAAIPDQNEFPNINPQLNDYSFPSYILTDEVLNRTLDISRIEVIRKEINSPFDSNDKKIDFILPGLADRIIPENSLDLILSQAVLGQVDDLENAYRSMKKWLKPSGLISHEVDLSCHGYTHNWNGHWTLTDFEWKIVRGGRTFAINRMPLSRHRELLIKYNFSALYEKKKTRMNELKRDQIALRFKDITDEDLETSGIYYIAQIQK